MKYAIDRYALGKEKEVSAEEFSGYIPDRHNRFFCPECGEIVYHRKGGGNQPSQFYHQERTVKSPECDNRVDGRSGLTLTQRVGLPLFLTCVSGYYQLNIGFPALGDIMFNAISSQEYEVKISAGFKSRTIKINETNFLRDETTLIPVNFIPTRGQNYTIRISGKEDEFDIPSKWSDYADGFSESGAIFSYSETGGKKIRRGDSISTNRYYYALIKKTFPKHIGIKQKNIGKITIDNTTFKVIQFKITVPVKNKTDFTIISRYLKNHFDVWLLEYPPELVPIWPPVVQRSNMIPVDGKSSVICAVSSGNDDPKVYAYSDYGVYPEYVDHFNGDINTVTVDIGQRSILLSVDRKYTGREIRFSKDNISYDGYKYKIKISDSLNIVSTYKSVNKKDIPDGITIYSNAKFNIYIGNKNHIYRCIALRECVKTISLQNGDTDILFCMEDIIVYHIHIEYTENKIDNHDFYLEYEKLSRKGEMVPIPRYIDYLLRELKNKYEEKTYNLIISSIRDGKIHLALLKRLLVDYKI